MGKTASVGAAPLPTPTFAASSTRSSIPTYRGSALTLMEPRIEGGGRPFTTAIPSICSSFSTTALPVCTRRVGLTPSHAGGSPDPRGRRPTTPSSKPTPTAVAAPAVASAGTPSRRPVGPTRRGICHARRCADATTAVSRVFCPGTRSAISMVRSLTDTGDPACT